MSRWRVGYVSGQVMTPEQSGIGRTCKVRSFSKYGMALRFLEWLKIVSPDEVLKGKFYLDDMKERG